MPEKKETSKKKTGAKKSPGTNPAKKTTKKTIREPVRDERVGAAVPEEPGSELAGLYDLVIPPGITQKLIVEITKKFDVEVVEHKERLYFANMEGDERMLLAFRGTLDVMKEVEKYLLQETKSFIAS